MIELSVIVPTLNRAELLDQMLDSLMHQTYSSDSFEIIIVDNGSNDHTTSVIEKYEKIFPNIRCIYESTPGLHVGRHCGMKASHSNILFSVMMI